MLFGYWDGAHLAVLKGHSWQGVGDVLRSAGAQTWSAPAGPTQPCYTITLAPIQFLWLVVIFGTSWHKGGRKAALGLPTVISADLAPILYLLDIIVGE